jgi:nucleoside-diphosphate-sugar epimerase
MVKDNKSGSYLGVICISSDFLDLTPRDEVIGWPRELKTQGGMINHTAIGSTIVPLQLLGFNYVGGKLLALLCLSDPVQQLWEKLYGDKLVSVTTTSLYGKTKAAGESIAKEIYGEKLYILRTAWLYSEYGKNFAKTICEMGMYGKNEIKVVDDQFGQPTSASDLANQIFRIIARKVKFGIYHATNSGQASRFDFAEMIMRLSGSEVERIVRVDSDSFPTLAKRPKFTVLEHNAWKNTGLSPMRNWKEALEFEMPKIIESVKAKNN